jgi:VCBS repeat-containing protein
MKKAIVLMGVLLALPSFAAAEDWANVSMIDTQCSTKAKADPDSHTKACAMACAKSGFGIVDKDGNYLKFDANGNQEAMKALQATNKQDHLRVDVSGKKVGSVIHVQSVKLL